MHDPMLISVDISGNDPWAVYEAGRILRAGGVVAYPTETFYGLGVDARNEAAIRKLFSVKKRPADRPVLVLIHSRKMLLEWVKSVPEAASTLMTSFWPGGLTLVFDAGPRVSPLITGGGGKIGVRLSSHPVAAALSRATDAPISGTSANVSGFPPCRRASEVSAVFRTGVDLVLDGGETPGKRGSTVVDVTVTPPKILRQGAITLEQLRAQALELFINHDICKE